MADDMQYQFKKEIGESVEKTVKMEITPSKSPLLIIVSGIIGALLVGVVVFYVVIMRQVKNLSQTPVVLKSAEVLGVPVATVNGAPILYTDYIDDVNTLARFYRDAEQGLPAITDEQISDMAISRLVGLTMVETIADNYGVEVTTDDIDAKKTELLANFASESEAEQEVMNTYGWSLDTYIDKVIIPLIREEKTAAAFASSTDPEGAQYQTEEAHARHILFRVEQENEDATVKAQAQEVLNRVKSGEDFAKLAQEFGSDGTSQVGGDLGWFGRGVMVKEFEDAAFALEPGQVSDELVKTEFGYHIIRVDEKRLGRNFTVFMDNQLRNAQIVMRVPIHNPFELLTPPQDAGATSTQG
ncbi:MAG: hypothetical protein A3J66_03620 [Candidatus Magasanikbacteria bacterium RIFCSPHIGHO2_02_FULL_47_14]|uniref:PpiC domain-containing protein n=1 Tax=Candidatus Magasanikbacteria bacterium RIFCSPHIGHO2_02_FULL_47_14 TaxID=1798680 RepID=A0A1F6M7G2_9BACT|nr:MAG: hypothetical protein A3J66_03620 [Candidatus Magasanikbacteria bacterium RIFCSPHIGHO2_02_FULL_47_14]